MRAEQAEARNRGVYRGLGLASFIELTNPGPAFYGVGGARISAQDGCTVRLDAAGGLTVQASVTEQGQGTGAILTQITAEAMGVPPERIRVQLGDTDATPYGGGTWASRGAGVGGEAAWQAARALRENVLSLAGALLQAAPDTLDIEDGNVVDAEGRLARISLADVARIAYFRPDTLPRGVQPELVATRHYVPREYPFAFTNGIQASWLEVDIETGFIKLLKHFVVEDCGTVLNPLLVDEQIRGGVVQGLGAALFERCDYDDQGQMTNANMADYLVPMAGEMPDITIAHVVTPTAESVIGAKGAGEAGTAGAAACVLNAVNDALAPAGRDADRNPADAGKDPAGAGGGNRLALAANLCSTRYRTISDERRRHGETVHDTNIPATDRVGRGDGYPGFAVDPAGARTNDQDRLPGAADRSLRGRGAGPGAVCAARGGRVQRGGRRSTVAKPSCWCATTNSIRAKRRRGRSS